MNNIKIDISKNFDDLIVFSNFQLELPAGTIYTIVGPTGCGKSTLLNILSGIETASQGKVKIPDDCNNISYLLQENVLLEWRSLYENIKLGIEVKTKFNKTHEEMITRYLKLFGIYDFRNYYPENLSGGMKQRAALIRCLCTTPNLLLLDEPFSNIDFDIKMKIQKELLSYKELLNATFIIITHDIEDAIALSDVVVVLGDSPTKIKEIIKIELGLDKKDPVLARQSKQFPYFFSKIWNTLKYIGD